MIKKQLELEKIGIDQLINTINDAIIIVDKNHKVVELNNYARALIDRENINSCGRKVDDVLKLTDISGNKLNIEDIFCRFNHKDDNINIPAAKLISKDNERFVVSINVLILRSKSNQVIGNIIILNDLTEHYNINEALRESEDKLRKIVSESNDGIILINEQCQIIEWNKGAEQITGFSRADVIFKDYVNFIYNLMPAQIKTIEKYNYYRELFMNALKEEHILEKQIWDVDFINKDGELRYSQQAFFKIKIDDGYWIGAIIRDVTESKKAELRLIEKEKFQNLVTEICARFLNAYTTSIFDEIEKALKEIKGFYNFIEYSTVYLFSNNLREVYPVAFSENTSHNLENNYKSLPADTKAWWLNHLERNHVLYINNFDFYSKGESEFLRNIHGKQFKSIIDFGLIDNGKVIGLLMFASYSKTLRLNKDIISLLTVVSEVFANSLIRRKREIELKNNEDKFREIVNATSSGILIIQDNKIVYVNEISKKRFGVGEFANKEYTFLKYLPPGKKKFAIEKIHEILSGKRDSYRTEIKLYDAEKKEEWRDITIGRTLFNNRLSLIVTLIDITERKKVQIENEKYRDHLKNLVNERTAELQYVNKQLKNEIKKQKEAEKKVLHALQKEKELNELKSRFITTASHEFKTPLTTVLSSAELLERYGQRWNEKKYKEQLRKIINSVEGLNVLINDILQAGKAESGTIEFNPQKMNLKDFVEKLVSELMLTTSKHNIDLYCFLKNEEYCLDENLLRLSLSNIINNAIKYSPGGGTIDIIIEEISSKLKIEIIDEGIGIPGEDIANIFLPFNRSVNAGNFPGTGLGLSIAKKSVELHGGSINVKSKIKKGTKFIIKFPLD
ncbi:MAG: PAS domain-containing sensor histidine kinase [Ignavibacteria bacterium]|jgi:PAS domain S-box-containing protein